MRKFLLALLVAAVVVGSVAVVGSGQPAPATIQSQESGNWTLEELRQGGEHPAEAPPSIRILDSAAGAVSIRYKPAKPLQQSEYQFLEPGTRLETNEIQVYSTVFESSGNYSLLVISWQQAERQVQTEDGIVTRRYAANVSEKRVTDLSVGAYETSNVSLPAHFNRTYQLTLILERNGEPVARWRATHASNPLSRSAPQTDSQGDLLAFGFINFFIPAAAGAVVARHRARKDLEDIVVGTMRGTLWWSFAIVTGLLLVATAIFYQTAVILSAAPWLSGISIGLLYYLGYLSFRDDDLEKAEFDQRDIEYVENPNGEQRPSATAAHKVIKRIYQDDNRVYIPKPGLLPMIARKWADPASIDKSEFKSVTEVTGDVDVEYSADPDADEVLDVQPAHLALDPPLLDPSSEELREDYLDQMDRLEAIHWSVALLAYVPVTAIYKLRRVNWTFVAIAVVGFALGYSVLNHLLGLVGVAIVVGLLPGLIVATQARDGSAEFTPAPKHMSDARAILSVDSNEYEIAATFDELEEQLAAEDLVGLEKARELMNAYRRALWKGIDESLGFAENGADDEDDQDTAVDPVGVNDE